MACEMMKLVCVLGLVLSIGLEVVLAQQPQVPGYFIFGDSLVDNGNNNNIASLAMANYLPYGIDFPGGRPTGRFCNGKTTVDVIAELLGFPNFIPPFARARGRAVLQGVNYASAAAGIREETGQQLGGRTPFSGQVRNYQTTVAQITSILGSEQAAAAHLSKCIFSIGLGSNDYLNNYFMPLVYSSSRQYTPSIHMLCGLLQTIYNYGARKFVLIGVGQVGCSPSVLAQRSRDGKTCVAEVNNANQIFNTKLKSLVDEFNNNFSDAKFIYIDAYGIFNDLLTKPGSYGLRVTNAGCCGVGRNNGQITCLPLQTPCRNRREYLFWDAFHPTEAANTVVAKRSYNAQSSSDAYPIDISRLAQL
uniref:GDSL esterase/lipase n=1 Tax=Kalanchoe fedtschenkoi TaxID=63787 RepID=A0A7N0V9C7_KALFE